MGFISLFIALVLSEKRNRELEKRIEGFESLTRVLSMKVDGQQSEIELMKQKGKVLKFNHLRKVA